MVYDARDRLVLTQDANLRTQSPVKWQYVLYDVLNRPINTGLWTNNFSRTEHALLASSSPSSNISYPDLAGQTFEELTQTFYDNYAWRSQYNDPLSSNYNTGFNIYLKQPSNTTWPYPQENIQSFQTKGLVTGTRIKVLGKITYLTTINIYDEKGRVIQVHSENITGGKDINSMQYSWAGQPLMTVSKQEKLGDNEQTTILLTQMEYDELAANAIVVRGGRILT